MKMKRILPLFLLISLLSCVEEKKPPLFKHTTTFEVRFGNGDIDTISCDYVNDAYDKKSYLLKEGCLKCGQFYYFMVSAACDVTTYKMIGDTSVVYVKQEQNE